MAPFGVRVFGFLFFLLGLSFLIAPQFTIQLLQGWKFKDPSATTTGRIEARLGGVVLLGVGVWLMVQ